MMRKTLLLLVSMTLAVLVACGLALAAAGQLDRSFGGDGRVTTGFGFEGQGALDLIRVAGGKIVAGGGGSNNNDLPTNALLARYNQDGSLDTSFGRNGRVVVKSSGTKPSGLRINDLALQEDGKIVAEVSGYTSQIDAILMRFNSDGSLDKTFGGGDGIVTSNVRTQDSAIDLRLWNGKLVIAGSSCRRGSGGFLVARYRSDGTPDPDFGGGDGHVVSTVGRYKRCHSASAEAVLASGRIVAGGMTGGGDFGLLRLRADGTPEASFGTNGRVVTNMGPDSVDRLEDLAVQPDGKILAGGSAVVSGGGGVRSVLVRYNPGGSLNLSFGGGDGKVLTDTGEGTRAVLLMPSGRLVTAGSTYAGARFYFLLARYLGE